MTSQIHNDAHKLKTANLSQDFSGSNQYSMVSLAQISTERFFWLKSVQQDFSGSNQYRMVRKKMIGTIQKYFAKRRCCVQVTLQHEINNNILTIL